MIPRERGLEAFVDSQTIVVRRLGESIGGLRRRRARTTLDADTFDTSRPFANRFNVVPYALKRTSEQIQLSGKKERSRKEDYSSTCDDSATVGKPGRNCKSRSHANRVSTRIPATEQQRKRYVKRACETYAAARGCHHVPSDHVGLIAIELSITVIFWKTEGRGLGNFDYWFQQFEEFM